MLPPGKDGAMPAFVVMRLPQDIQLVRLSVGVDSCTGPFTHHTGWVQASLPAGWGYQTSLDRAGVLQDGHSLSKVCLFKQKVAVGLWGLSAGGCLTFPEPQARGRESHQWDGGHEGDAGRISPPRTEG